MVVHCRLVSTRRRSIALAGRQWLHFILPCALVVLVAVLGTLQYRWAGQIADAERQRMRASAEARARQFAEEFDGELARVSFAFSQVPPASQPGFPAHVPSERTVEQIASADPIDVAAHYADAYARWVASTPHPELIRALYLFRVRDGGETFSKLADGRFEPAQWPPELERVRSRAHTPEYGKLVGFAPLAPDVPALILPVARLQLSELGSEGRRVRIMNVVGITGVLIVELNSQYIERQWLPALARRYFGRGGEFDYNVAVLGARRPTGQGKADDHAEAFPSR